MTKLNKWVLIEAGHDEDEHGLDFDVLDFFDTKEEAKEALKEAVEEWCDDDNDISWDDEETKVTITSSDGCDNWCKAYKIEEI